MSNNFLLFDPNGVNMLSDEAYSTDGERLNGMAQGISRSILFNKILRQSSSMVAALGQVISERGYDALDNNQSSLVEGLKSAFPENRGLPVSTLIPYTGHLVDRDDLLVANGEPFDPVEYEELADVYRISGNTYLYGQVQKSAGVWWPKTPDFRGAFIRGLDLGKGKDPNRSLGTEQGDAIRNITGECGNYGNGVSGSNPYSKGAMYVRAYSGVPGESEDYQGVSAIYGFDASRVVPTASENRPYNYAVYFLIVAKSGFNMPSSQGGGSSATIVNLTIASTDWEDNSAVKEVEGVTETANIDLGLPVPTTLDNSQAISMAGLVITALEDGAVTFSCKIVPTVDINVTLKIWSN